MEKVQTTMATDLGLDLLGTFARSVFSARQADPT